MRRLPDVSQVATKLFAAFKIKIWRKQMRISQLILLPRVCRSHDPRRRQKVGLIRGTDSCLCRQRQHLQFHPCLVPPRSFCRGRCCTTIACAFGEECTFRSSIAPWLGQIFTGASLIIICNHSRNRHYCVNHPPPSPKQRETLHL